MSVSKGWMVGRVGRRWGRKWGGGLCCGLYSWMWVVSMVVGRRDVRIAVSCREDRKLGGSTFNRTLGREKDRP